MIFEEWLCDELIITMSDDEEVKTEGKIIMFSNGAVEIQFQLNGSLGFEDFAEKQEITGKTRDGLEIRAPGSYALTINPRVGSGITSVVFSPTECVMSRPGASEVTRFEAYLKSVLLKGICEFTFDKTHYVIKPIQKTNERRSGLIKCLLLINDNIDYGDILTLLSLAQRCPIGNPLQKSYNGSTIVKIRLLPDERPYDVVFPLVPQNSTEIASFFNQTLPNLSSANSNYKLQLLIPYYCLSVSNEYPELKFILASVFMESFKFYWALNVGEKSPVRKASGLIKGFEKSKNKKGEPVFYSFQELLEEACVSIGLDPTFTFIEDRNALFHTGAPSASQLGSSDIWGNIKPELVTLYRQIDDILLTILGYNGPVLRWDNPNTMVNFP